MQIVHTLLLQSNLCSDHGIVRLRPNPYISMRLIPNPYISYETDTQSIYQYETETQSIYQL